MVFSSYEFIFIFLPIVLVGYFLIDGRIGSSAGLIFLLMASYVFYGWGENQYLMVPVGVSVLNYVFGLQIARSYRLKLRSMKWWLAAGIAINLGVLAFFKYSGFVVEIFRDLFRVEWRDPEIVLPLGISFFVFHALAYIVDSANKGRAESSLPRLALFMGFFPIWWLARYCVRKSSCRSWRCH